MAQELYCLELTAAGQKLPEAAVDRHRLAAEAVREHHGSAVAVVIQLAVLIAELPNLSAADLLPMSCLSCPPLLVYCTWAVESFVRAWLLQVYCFVKGLAASDCGLCLAQARWLQWWQLRKGGSGVPAALCCFLQH